jgi:hypothetical protein
MATLTKLESKLAEVTGLAMAAQDTVREVRGMLGSEYEALDAKLAQAGEEAREAQERCTELAGSFDGKKTAILDKAREVKQEATEMRESYLAGEDDPLDGFEFLTMAEAGEVGHWTVLQELNKQARHAGIRKLISTHLPIQKRHLKDTMAASVRLAAKEDANAAA